MTRLYIFAEGQTEQTYGDTVLKKHLAAFGVYVQGPILIAHRREKGVTHRGGGRHYLPMKNDILRFLRQEKAPDVYFTTMIDLYAIPADFPGMSEAEQLRHLPYDRVAKLEEHFAADIDDPCGRPTRLIPHIQLHEFEAILLCRPEAFTSFFGECRRQIRAIESQYPQHTAGIDRRRPTHGPVKTHFGAISRLQRRKTHSGTPNRRGNRDRNGTTLLPTLRRMVEAIGIFVKPVIVKLCIHLPFASPC